MTEPESWVLKDLRSIFEEIRDMSVSEEIDLDKLYSLAVKGLMLVERLERGIKYE